MPELTFYAYDTFSSLLKNSLQVSNNSTQRNIRIMCGARIFLRLNIALMECFLLFCIKCWQANLYTFREQLLFIKAYTHFLNSEQSVHCSVCTVFQLLNVVFVSHRRVSLLCPFANRRKKSLIFGHPILISPAFK